jgi:hypothetical protein
VNRKSGVITLIIAVLLVSFNPGFFCSAEGVVCEGWVSKITREME